MPPQFHHRPHIGKARPAGSANQCPGQAIIINMRGFSARIADQKDAIVAATGVAIGDIGIGAFNPAGQIAADKQIQNTINAVGRHPLAASCRNAFCHIIGRNRPPLRRQRGKNIGAHLGPLLTRLLKCVARRIGQCMARMFVVVVPGHATDIGMT